VRGVVADQLERLGVAVGDDRDLLTVGERRGEVTHVTACGARIAADEPVLLAAAPPADHRCSACDGAVEPDDVAAWERWRETTAPGARR
jgi:hypothetical protein